VGKLSTPPVVYEAILKYQAPAASPSIEALVMEAPATSMISVRELEEVP
jgi:hypothetical protein